MNEAFNKFNIVVALPCFNEEATIAKVIDDFKRVLPGADIHVFDNSSTDNSAVLSKKAGAKLFFVKERGKGNVIRSIFENIDADILLVVDSDDTYSADDAPVLIRRFVDDNADMVIGDRLNKAYKKSMSILRLAGNRMIVRAINLMFGSGFHDVLSGHRVFGRRYLEEIKLNSTGFEIETELTLMGLVKGMKILEVPVSYRRRPAGSSSKLRLFRDGFKILSTAVGIFWERRKPGT